MATLKRSVAVRNPATGRAVALAKDSPLPEWAVGLVDGRHLREDANTEQGVGVDGANQGGDAASSGDGVDIHDVDPEAPEPTPETSAEPAGADEAEGEGPVASSASPDADVSLDSTGSGVEPPRAGSAPNLRAVLEGREKDELLADAEALELDVDGRWGKARLVDAILAHYDEG